MIDIISDTLLDGLRLLPFLFATYLFMEFLERRAGDRLLQKISAAGRSGPLWGAAFGIVPQCGFSAAASGLFAGRVITAGTLIAIYLSTSDEMLPILVSNAVSPVKILRILLAKFAIGAASGFLLELCGRVLRRNSGPGDMRAAVEGHGHGDDGILLPALRHTLRIFIYILLISFVLNVLVWQIGTHGLRDFFAGEPILGHMAAALVGLIPNCASSVAITSLYLDGIIDDGIMMAGLLANAGVGLLVLFRLNKNSRQNLCLVCLLYAFAVFWGLLVSLCGIRF